jgi:hypothetical protein
MTDMGGDFHYEIVKGTVKGTRLFAVSSAHSISSILFADSTDDPGR